MAMVSFVIAAQCWEVTIPRHAYITQYLSLSYLSIGLIRYKKYEGSGKIHFVVVVKLQTCRGARFLSNL
jgi:hypothetical protein